MADPLSPEDLSALQEDGVLLPGPQAGKRKISASFLQTPPSSGSSSAASTILSTTSTASIRYYDTQPYQVVPDFPDKQESAAALEYIGLQPATAKEIFDRWQSRSDPDQNPDELLDYVYGHLSQLRQTSWQGYSDAEALQRLGVAPWLCSVLLNSRFKDIYETETLQFWLKETFRGNYRSITTIQQQLKVYVKDRGNKKKKKQKRASIKDAFLSPPGEASSSSDPIAPAHHVATVSFASDSGYLPQTHISVGAAEPILPDHKIFYKAKSAYEMAEHHMLIAEDGSINMRPISSYCGGDFNPVDRAWYWTPEYETAVKYRDWAVERMRFGEVVIIRIQVPISFLRTLRQEELWYSANWKEYIWTCKKQLRPKDIPSKFTKYWKPGPEQTDVMLGHIYFGVIPKITKIRPNEVQTTINEDKVLKIGNNKATQWVVMHEDVAEKLAIQVRGKMHIEIFWAREPKDQ
ncbi:hypothetical protein GQ44DRAFT_714129 [Phaeosphaeriaceae sp. PMI808]|nr:hypothetical protein GQ44DRAFT_714129 [Phaeosphaeriaceae sp. PMI808]